MLFLHILTEKRGKDWAIGQRVGSRAVPKTLPKRKFRQKGEKMPKKCADPTKAAG